MGIKFLYTSFGIVNWSNPYYYFRQKMWYLSHVVMNYYKLFEYKFLKWLYSPRCIACLSWCCGLLRVLVVQTPFIFLVILVYTGNCMIFSIDIFVFKIVIGANYGWNRKLQPRIMSPCVFREQRFWEQSSLSSSKVMGTFFLLCGLLSMLEIDFSPEMIE